jgi:general secretion pathway protein M
MIRLDREQVISVGLLAALLFACITAMSWSWLIRSGAARELDERRAFMSRLEARAKARSDARARSGATAPAAAFLDAPTQGLAVAALQGYLAKTANAHHGLLVASGMEPAGPGAPPDMIRMQATLEMSAEALQAFLYQIESGMPYVFVDALTVQLTGAASQHAAEDPSLRVTFGLHAIWRRGPA